MYIVRNSPRALFAALIPLAVVHAALLAMALVTTKVVRRESIRQQEDVASGMLARNAP